MFWSLVRFVLMKTVEAECDANPHSEKRPLPPEGGTWGNWPSSRHSEQQLEH